MTDEIPNVQVLSLLDDEAPPMSKESHSSQIKGPFSLISLNQCNFHLTPQQQVQTIP